LIFIPPMSNTEQFNKFKSEIQAANWDMLAPHFKRDALFLIDSKIELADAAVALANDDATKVKLWQKNGQFKKPETDEVESWSKDTAKDFAEFLIVQPFVLIRLI
jgi:hypothetical protein